MIGRKPQVKTHLVRPRRRWENNNKMESILRVTVSITFDRIRIGSSGGVLNTVMKL
jgi:hypothetical protein